MVTDAVTPFADVGAARPAGRVLARLLAGRWAETGLVARPVGDEAGRAGVAARPAPGLSPRLAVHLVRRAVALAERPAKATVPVASPARLLVPRRRVTPEIPGVGAAARRPPTCPEAVRLTAEVVAAARAVPEIPLLGPATSPATVAGPRDGLPAGRLAARRSPAWSATDLDVDAGVAVVPVQDTAYAVRGRASGPTDPHVDATFLVAV